MMDGVEATPPLPPGQAGQIAEFLRAGGRFVILTGPARTATRTVLEQALWAVPGLVIRTGNPLSTPLSLSRLMLQVGADPHAEDEAAALLSGIAAHADGTGRAVLSIDDAHTLEPEALAALAHLPLAGPTDAFGVQLVFAGRPALLDLLRAAGIPVSPEDSRLDVTLDGPVEPAAVQPDGEAPAPAPRPRLASFPQPVPPPPPPLVRPLRTPVAAAPVDLPEPVPFVPMPPEPMAGAAGLARGAPRPALKAPPRRPAPAARPRASRVQPGARRRPPLVLPITAGLCTGLAGGLGALWLLGILTWPGLPRSPVADTAPAAGAAAVLAPPAEPSPAPVSEPSSPQAPAAPYGTAPATQPSPATTTQPAPATTQPAQPAPAAPIPEPGPPQGPSETRLRRDFDAFVRRSGWNATARTPEAREALFRDYKEWLARRRAGPAPGTPQATAPSSER